MRTPAMDELPNIGGDAEFHEGGALERARPISGLDLAEHDVRGANTHKVPFTKGSGRARTAVARGFEERHGTMLIACALGLTIFDRHGASSAAAPKATSTPRQAPPDALPAHQFREEQHEGAHQNPADGLHPAQRSRQRSKREKCRPLGGGGGPAA